jgi:hypothetical protein
MMPAKSIVAASLWKLIYDRGKTSTARTGQQNTDGAATAASPGTLGAFTYKKGAMGLNPDDHAEASGICSGSGQPFCVDGHLDLSHAIDIGVMNGDFPPPLLAFNEDHEVFVNSHWMAFSSKGWPVNRGDRVEVVIGNFRARSVSWWNKARGT